MKIKSVKSGNAEQDVPGVSLRSEKTRKLLGDIPGSLINWGAAVTVFFFIALILALCLIPYPYSEGESLLAHILGYS